MTTRGDYGGPEEGPRDILNESRPVCPHNRAHPCELCQRAKAGLTDPVQRPKHYNSHPSGIECIQVTRHFGFNLGNVIKYLWRAEEKGAPIEDLKKARWYLDDEINRREAAADPRKTT